MLPVENGMNGALVAGTLLGIHPHDHRHLPEQEIAPPVSSLVRAPNPLTRRRAPAGRAHTA